MPLVGVAVGRGVRIDGHAADRVARARMLRGGHPGRGVVSVRGMRLRVVHGLHRLTSEG